jgi:hypothetical protein
MNRIVLGAMVAMEFCAPALGRTSIDRDPSCYVWKEMNTRASLEGRFAQPIARTLTAFTAAVQATTANTVEQLPFYPLRDYELAWDMRSKNNEVIPSGAQALPDLAGIDWQRSEVGSQSAPARTPIQGPGGMPAPTR